MHLYAKSPLWINWSRHFPLHSQEIHSGRRCWPYFNKNCPQHDKSLHCGHCCRACRSPSEHSSFVSCTLCMSTSLFVCDSTARFRKCGVPACRHSSPSSLTCTVCRIDAKQLSNSHWAKHSLGWRGLACGQGRLNTSSENQHRPYSCNKQRRRTRWLYLNCEPGSMSTGSTLVPLYETTTQSALMWSRFIHSMCFTY